MRFQSYFNTALIIIDKYNGLMSLQRCLKQYFSLHKKHGSNDRKNIAHLVYTYYRLGCALKELSIPERLCIAIFLCNENAGRWNFLYNDIWLQHWNGSLQQRIEFIKSRHQQFDERDVFRFHQELSNEVDALAFTRSHLIQPDVFLRIRPHKKPDVITALQQKKIFFQQIETDCLIIPPATNVNAILKIDKEVVIQDYSSQQIQKFFQIIKPSITDLSSSAEVLDCCAGSGGKSILAYDIFDNLKLTVSDIRPSIIHNLKNRFQHTGITNYTYFVADVTKTILPIPASGFDLIICDAPCSGSGTWGRAPEQLSFFQSKKIDEYALLQQRIISNTIPLLKKAGYFLYITCSVFKKENDAAAEFIQTKFHLKLIKMELIKGYDKKAGTMFAALFQS